MKINIPKQLQKEEFRFYLIRKNSKLPIEKSWNTKNNYSFDSYKLTTHSGNYGVVCGYGNLIVIDFDDKEYLEDMKDKLPKTFMVLTATKRLYHYYYILKGEIFKKYVIKGKDNKTLCDIQALKSGVVAPNSSIDNKYYEANNNEIAEIDEITLKFLFKINKLYAFKEFKGEKKSNVAKMNIALAALHLCDVKATAGKNMKCPFHNMKGQGNLSITSSGKIYCFDCLINLWADEFIAKYFKISHTDAKKIVKGIEHLYYSRKER